MKKLNQILSKSFALLLIVLIPFSYNGVLVFKHICNSSNTVKVYLYINDKCSNESEDTCCSEEIHSNIEDNCCDELNDACLEQNHQSESLKSIEASKCCLDETNDFSVKAQILNKEKYNPTTFRTSFYSIQDDSALLDQKAQFLSNSDNFAFSPPNFKIISFIRNNSQDKSSDSHLS